MELVVQGETYELTSEQTEGIFRLCQESITNSIRHGKAKHSHIIIRYEKHQVQVFVIDDGQGCSTIKPNYGLSGIEARIKALKGEVSFGSDGERGFHIHANIPVKQSGG
jgi:signal transduction histidine kinase